MGSSRAGAERVKGAAAPPLSVRVRTGLAACLPACRGAWLQSPQLRAGRGRAAGLGEGCAGAAAFGGRPWGPAWQRRLSGPGPLRGWVLAITTSGVRAYRVDSASAPAEFGLVGKTGLCSQNARAANCRVEDNVQKGRRFRGDVTAAETRVEGRARQREQLVRMRGGSLEEAAARKVEFSVGQNGEDVQYTAPWRHPLAGGRCRRGGTVRAFWRRQEGEG